MPEKEAEREKEREREKEKIKLITSHKLLIIVNGHRGQRRLQKITIKREAIKIPWTILLGKRKKKSKEIFFMLRQLNWKE